jgi:DNA-binding transcriptional ArsR family regulator
VLLYMHDFAYSALGAMFMPKRNGYYDLARLFRALSHPARLLIVESLAREEACVCHLTTLLARPQPYVSQQLAILREAGLVTDRRDGTLIFYRLSEDAIVALLREGKGFLETSGQGMPAFPDVPAAPLPGCPCPRCTG